MGVDSQKVFNAADVVDAIFSGMMLRNEWNVTGNTAQGNRQTVECLIETIDDGLKAAGLSFAEYLERIRHAGDASASESGQRWRFSARERTMQRIDNAVADLCAIMQPQDLDS